MIVRWLRPPAGRQRPPAVASNRCRGCTSLLYCCTAERTKRVLWGLVPGGDLVQLSGGALGVVQNASRPQPAIVGRQSPPVSQDRGRVGDCTKAHCHEPSHPARGPPSAARSIVCST